MTARPAQREHLLAAIPTAATELETETDRLRAALVAAIANARDAGASWADVGVYLGTSRQAAHERFGAAVWAHQQERNR